MALTDQPYLPLYVDDWMNNLKLRQCSQAAHGMMIAIMTLMHKSNDGYGKILLKQKYKQTSSFASDFATQLSKHFPWTPDEMVMSLQELLDEKILVLDGEYLICERMVRDANISELRKKSGSKGGQNNKKNSNNFAYAKHEANIQANAGNGDGIENEDVIEVVNNKNGTRISENFTVTEEMKAFALSEGIEDVQRETQKFIDYWLGVPGKAGRKLDWVKTWQNRIRDLADWKLNGSQTGRGANAKHKSGVEKHVEFDKKDYGNGW